MIQYKKNKSKYLILIRTNFRNFKNLEYEKKLFNFVDKRPTQKNWQKKNILESMSQLEDKLAPGDYEKLNEYELNSLRLELEHIEQKAAHGHYIRSIANSD